MTEADYGVTTDLYTILAFLMVLLTYGFETAFFRFSEKYSDRKTLVFATATRSILTSTLLFLALVYIFRIPILEVLRYEDYPEYLWMLLGVISADVLAAVPMAKLRSERRVSRFVRNRLVVIVSNVLLNLFFFLWLPGLAESGGWIGDFCQSIYWPEEKVVYVLLANLLANGFMLIDLFPEFWKIRIGFDWKLWKEMIRFSSPLILAGFAGVANELMDRQFIKYVLPEETSMNELGIYSAVYKLSIGLVLFNQAFRYAAEPLFFSEGEHGKDRKLFAQILQAFTLVMTFGLVVVLGFADLLKELFIDEKFWGGMHILPILLLANVFLGIHTNLSIWYKLSDQTRFGIYITGIGFVFTAALNLLLLPILGIEGAAWATLASYAAMATASYLFGQIHYPIPYRIKSILFYLLISSVLGYLAFRFARPDYLVQLACIASFVGIVALTERQSLSAIRNRMKRK